jgi:hypothetical protein
MEGFRVEWMSLPQNRMLLASAGPINAVIRNAVQNKIRQENESIAATIKKLDAEMRKGYSILDSQWTEFYRYYFTLGRGPSSDMPLKSMFRTCLNNLTKWQRMRDERNRLASLLSLPRTFDATVSMDNINVAVRITTPGTREYKPWTLT